MIYHVIPLVVAAYSLSRGYRKGFNRQIPKLIGFCFGIVCAHLFSAPAEECMRSIFPGIASRVEGGYIYSVLSTGSIYILIYFLLNICTSFLKLIFRSKPEIIGRLTGSLFCFIRYMLMLSVMYNIWLGMNPRSELMKFAKSDDGNIVEMVMLISPAVLGGESVEDLAHKLQLEDAKSIS